MINLTEDMPKPIIEHLHELRKRVIQCLAFFIVSFGIAYYFSESIFNFLVTPLTELMSQKGSQHRFIYTGLTEVFLTYLKIAFFAALFVTFPFILVHAWLFISPGLYKIEKTAIKPFLYATPIMFFIGGMVAYFAIFPLAFNFFLSFETVLTGNIPVQLEARIYEYLSLSMSLMLAFGIAFELPVILLLLAKLGIIAPEVLIKNRRYAILIIFIVAAVLTPPDVFSMMGLVIPLLILYELSILLIKRMNKDS